MGGKKSFQIASPRIWLLRKDTYIWPWWTTWQNWGVFRNKKCCRVRFRRWCYKSLKLQTALFWVRGYRQPFNTHRGAYIFCHEGYLDAWVNPSDPFSRLINRTHWINIPLLAASALSCGAMCPPRWSEPGKVTASGGTGSPWSRQKLWPDHISAKHRFQSWQD